MMGLQACLAPAGLLLRNSLPRVLQCIQVEEQHLLLS